MVIAMAICAMGIVFMIGGPLFQSLAIWLLWGWYFIPLGCPQISYGVVVAVNFIVCMLLTAGASPYPHEQIQKTIEREVAHNIVLPGLALILGWTFR